MDCSSISKSDLFDEIKRDFFQAMVVSVLLYGCTTLTLTKHLDKRVDGDYSRILRAVLNSLQNISFASLLTAGEVRTNSSATFSYGRASVCRLAKIYILHLCSGTGCKERQVIRAYCEKELENPVLSARLDDDKKHKSYPHWRHQRNLH